VISYRLNDQSVIPGRGRVNTDTGACFL